MRARDRERGAALVLVLLVILVLAGLGLMALRQTRTQMLSTGHVRASRQAYNVAYGGLLRVAPYVGYYHRQIVRAILDGRTFVLEPSTATTPAGIFNLENPLAVDTAAAMTRDVERIGRTEYRVVVTGARPTGPPPGMQAAGPGNTPAFSYYVYELDVSSWINRTPGTLQVAPGGGGAMRRLRAEVRAAGGP